MVYTVGDKVYKNISYSTGMEGSTRMAVVTVLKVFASLPHLLE
jgi:hypothetical protein